MPAAGLPLITSLDQKGWMPETTGRDGGRCGKPQGGAALIGVALAMIAALAGVHPANALLVALNEVLPQLAAALPPVIRVRGAVLAAVGEPPGVGRK